MNDRAPEPPPNGDGISWCRYFRHWRTGELLDAWDYGHKAWPIRRRG